MKVFVTPDPSKLGKLAGSYAASLIRQAINANGSANIILATGTSQFETLKQLVSEAGIDWSKVTMFHLDEYIGLPVTSKASFRKYLKERFIDKVPDLKSAHLIDGEADAEDECMRLGKLIKEHPVDVALVGVGENGHLAFNDPPADFNTTEPYIIVQLDEACRKQQLGEGWFENLEAVPARAISMSIQQILKSKHIVCSVPDSRKALAVRNCIESSVTNLFPASILQLHSDCTCYLDRSSAALLSNDTIKATSNPI